MANKLPIFTQFESRPRARSWMLAGLAVVCGAWWLFAGEQVAPALADPETPVEAKKPEETPLAADTQRANAEAARVLSQARERMGAYSSIRADIVENVLIGSRRYRATGSYLQGGDRQIRLEYQMSVPGADGKPIEGALLEVSDGSILQTSYKIGSDLRITRRDLKQIFEAIAANPSMNSEVQASKLGLGGLPSLLASLEKSMSFQSVSTEEIQGTPYVVLKGGWSEEYRAKILPKDAKALPPYIPDWVWIYFDEATLFPRRVYYFKDEGGKPQPMMTLDFLNIRTNVAVNNEEFFFVPPKDVVIQDVTQQMIQQIRSAAAPAKTETDAAPAK